jgi:hypothetical protein
MAKTQAASVTMIFFFSHFLLLCSCLYFIGISRLCWISCAVCAGAGLQAPVALSNRSSRQRRQPSAWVPYVGHCITLRFPAALALKPAYDVPQFASSLPFSYSPAAFAALLCLLFACCHL